MHGSGGESAPRHPVLVAMANGRRRRVLSLVGERTSPVGELELATKVAAVEDEKPLVDVTRERAEHVHTDLVHAQLPRLAEANLVEWDRDEGTVAATTHPALEDPRFRKLVETDADGWDDVLGALAHRRRRVVLAVLADHDGPMVREALAARVRTDEGEGDAGPTDVPADVRSSLHHVHLPKLDAAGLVAYEPDEATVTYEGHPALDEEWLAFAPTETPRAVLTVAENSREVWTIEGRENVLERGRSLIDRADEELFLLFTTDGLLEEECFRAFENAVERGVDVYVGSQTQAVRDAIRERTPEVTIWEPQLDWLNLPPHRETVGRLVFADRRAIMLATLGEPDEAGVHAETAITGAGEDNALVVLLRELLGSRLDHLDAQSEDFRSQIPL